MPVLAMENLSYAKLSKLDRQRTVVVATLSPIEVHGPHLPVGEDFMTAYAATAAAGERYNEDHPETTFLLLPPIPVAADGVPKLGTVPFPPALVREVAYHSLRVFAELGFTRLAYASFHGGPRHLLALEDAANSLCDAKRGIGAISVFSAALGRLAEGRLFYDAVADDPTFPLSLDEVREDHHAGFVETSLALLLWPEKVDDGWQDLPPSVARTASAEDETTDSFLFGQGDRADMWRKVKQTGRAAEAMARSLRHFQTHTYYGRPAAASAQRGQKLFDAVVDLSLSILTEFIEQGPAMDAHSPLWKARHVLLNKPLNNVFDTWLNPVKDEG